MSWAKKHPVEVVAELGAPAVLAIAAGWAASAFGLPMAAVAAAGVIVMALAIMVMRLAAGAPIAAKADFLPVPFEDAKGELGELLLDDPLIGIESNARVVQLFERPEPTPGELVARIEDYLDDGRRAAAPEAAEHRSVDASAALHAALANIRASLR